MNFRYPVFLDLAGKNCLVAGEGFEIAAKVKALVEASANVIYVNPRAEPKIEQLAQAGLIRWHARQFEPGDLSDCFLVISDLDDNSEVFRLAEEQQILCNAVDDPQNCRFSSGSILRRGDLTIAISTNGWAPALAVRLREQFEREIGPEYGEFLYLLQELRPEISSRFADFATRRELWYRIIDSDILAMLGRGDKEKAQQKMRAILEGPLSNTSDSRTSGGDADQ